MDDPFGRVSQSQADRYASVREALRRTGVNDLDKARHCLRSIAVNAFRLSAVIVVAALVVWILLPEGRGVATVLAALALLWVGVSTFNGRRFVCRYMAEELGEREDPSI